MGPHNETLSIAAMRVSNPDRQPTIRRVLSDLQVSSRPYYHRFRRVYECVELLWIFMLDRSLALRLGIGPWAASGEDSS
jgi:hypothetical protein